MSNKLDEARAEVIETARDSAMAEVDRSEGSSGGTDLGDVEKALGAFEDAVRLDAAEYAEQDTIVRMLLHIATTHGADRHSYGTGWVEAHFHLGGLIYTLLAGLDDFSVSLTHTGSTCAPSEQVAQVLYLWAQILKAAEGAR